MYFIYNNTKHVFLAHYAISLSAKNCNCNGKIIVILKNCTFIVSDTLTMNGKFHPVTNGNFKLIKLFGAFFVSVCVQLSICKI